MFYSGFIVWMYKKHPDLIQLDYKERHVICKDLGKSAKYHYKWRFLGKVKGEPSKQLSVLDLKRFDLKKAKDCFKKAFTWNKRGKFISSTKMCGITSCKILILDKETWKYLCENVRLY